MSSIMLCRSNCHKHDFIIVKVIDIIIHLVLISEKNKVHLVWVDVKSSRLEPTHMQIFLWTWQNVKYGQDTRRHNLGNFFKVVFDKAIRSLEPMEANKWFSHTLQWHYVMHELVISITLSCLGSTIQSPRHFGMPTNCDTHADYVISKSPSLMLVLFNP